MKEKSKQEQKELRDELWVKFACAALSGIYANPTDENIAKSHAGMADWVDEIAGIMVDRALNAFEIHQDIADEP